MINVTKLTPSILAKAIDHTLLRANATPDEIEILCREALELGCATVCVNPANLPLAVRELVGSDVQPITVIGFPLGSVPTTWKVEETKRALDMGAQEIDMVINIGLFLAAESSLRALFEECSAVVQAAGAIPVKVIIETALLSDDQIIKASKTVAESGAAFVKTSTGFSSRGASVRDIELMLQGIKSSDSVRTQVKASGGIRTLDQAYAMLAAGATRIGSSSSMAIMKELKNLQSQT